ncbi:hypothetical protein OFS96_25730 [Escherichia coli]|nr:hypothetical protein [Escherichia coli]
MPDIDSISVAFPVKSMRGAEHFVMNATEEETRRGFAKVMSEFGEFLGHVDKALSIRGQFGYRKLLYVKLIFYHFWFFWKRNILDVKTVMRGH